MTDPVPSKACPVCDTPDGDHLDWCTPQAREQRPSKDLCSQLRGLTAGARLLGYTAAEEIERLRTALRGIQSCSTCEACRGAATLALGGAAPEPAVNPFDQAKAVFAGKKGDGFLLKLWFETQEDLDKAFDVVEGPAQPPGDGQT